MGDQATLRDRATAIMEEYIRQNGYNDMNGMVAYAYSLISVYGEASAALACEMYDALAIAQGVAVPAAIPAKTMDIKTIAETFQKISETAPITLPNSVGRFVKQAGADTMLQNAQRDKAQFAWIPNGDTCAFCLTIASNGWRNMSKRALKNGHASHIHSNCDCEFCVRFDESSGVAGYDPDRYLQIYENADGRSSKDKINAMRRDFYAQDKERINEQKRTAYARRAEESELMEDI